MVYLIWILVPLTVMLSAAVYLCRKAYKGVCFFAKKVSKRKQILIAAAVSAILILPVIDIDGLWFVVLMHLAVFLLVQDAVVLVVRKCFKQKRFPFFAKALYHSGTGGCSCSRLRMLEYAADRQNGIYG